MSNHFGLIFFWLFKTKPFCWVGSPWTPLFFGAYGEILSESTKLSGSRSPRGFLLLQTLESLQWGYPASRHGFNGLTKTSKNGGLVGRWMEDVEVSTLKQRGWFGPLIFRFHVSFGEGNIWKILQNCSPSLTTPSYPSCNGFNPLPRFHCNPRHPKNPKNSESDPSDWSRKYSDSSGVLRAAQPPICLCWNKRHSTP